MVVGAAGAEAVAALDELGRERAGVRHHLLAVVGEFRPQRLAEGHGLGGDDVHQRAALAARENLAIELGGDLLVVREDQAAARAAERLVRGGGDHVRMRERARVHARGHQARDVRDVRHEERAHRIGDGAEAREVDDARVGAVAADDHLRLGLEGDLLDGVVVEKLGGGIQAVLGDLVEGAAEVGLQAMAQVAAALDGKAQDRVARLEERHERRDVGVGAAVRLDVGKAALEELLGALAGDVLDLVVELAAAVVALAGVALGVLVGEPAAGRVHHGGRDVVLAGDEFERRCLAVGFLGHEGRDVRILRADELDELERHGIEGGGSAERGGTGGGGHEK